MGYVDVFLAKHNYPPGNSQTLLASHGFKKEKECYFCKKNVEHLFKTQFISGLVVNCCKDCLQIQKRKTTVKKVIGVV